MASSKTGAVLSVTREGAVVCAVDIIVAGSEAAAEVAEYAVPYVKFATKAIEEIKQFCDDYTFATEQADSLPNRIQQCSDIIQNEMFPAVWREMEKDSERGSEIKPSFCKVASDFIQMVYAIKELCKNWKGKSRLKKAWSTKAYKKKFTELPQELERFKLNVLMAFEAKMLGSALEQLNALEKKADEILAEVNITTGDQPPNSLLPESPILYGREEEVKKLSETLDVGGRIAALVGGAGMGKTHCASHFAHEWLQEDAANRFVLWLEADTENVVRVSYLEALEKLLGGEVPDLDEEMSVRDLACLVWENLGEQSTQFEWMVVYNNVPEALGDLEGPEAFSPLFFPTPLQDWGRGRILLTTRCTSYGGRIKSLGNHQVSKISVEPLDESTAVTMLMDSLDTAATSESEKGAAKEVVEMFGYLPLAIVTANSQMVAASLTVSEYLDDLKAGLAKSEVNDAVSLALVNALKYARNHGLGHVLEVAAFLSPDQLTLELLDCDRNTARRLCRLSLLRHAGGDVYTIHRLHQEAARDGISPSKSIIAIRSALTRFDAKSSDTWKFGFSLVPHLEALVENVEAMEKNDARSLEFLDNVEYARLLNSTAQILHYALHNYDEARLHYNKSLERMKYAYGPDAKNIDFALTLDNLGILEMKLGSYEEARSNYEKALEMKRHVCGPDAKNTDVASTLNNLGLLENDSGNYEKARSYLEESFEMKRHVYGPNAKNTDLASTLGNLGNLEQMLGNYDKARSRYEQALEMQRHVYGPNAKNTVLASTLANLGNLESQLGNYDKARSYYEESFEMFRHVYGPDAKNVDLAWTLNNLGILEMELGNYEKSRSYYEESLKMKQHVYGPDAKNTDLASTLANLGNLESQLGNYDKARSYYEESLEMFRHLYGPDAKNTGLALTLNNVGELERKLGNYDIARSYYEKAFEMERHVYGPDATNTDLASTLHNLGNLESDLGNYDKARSYYEQSFEMQRHVYGPDARNTDVASTLNNLGNLEMKLGNYEQARLHFDESLAMVQQVCGRDTENVDLAGFLDSLGCLEMKLGNYEEARLRFEKSLETMRHLCGPDAKTTVLAEILHNFGDLEMKLGNYDEARTKFKEALDMAINCLGDNASSNHPLVKKIRKDLSALSLLENQQGC